MTKQQHAELIAAMDAILTRIEALEANQNPKCANCGGTGKERRGMTGMIQCGSCKGKGH